MTQFKLSGILERRSATSNRTVGQSVYDLAGCQDIQYVYKYVRICTS